MLAKAACKMGGTMKKIIKSWGFVLSISALVLLGCVFISLCSSEATSPSKGWSRAVRITEVDNTTVKDFSLVRVSTLPMVKDNAFATFWETGNILNYQMVSSIGEIINKGTINYKFPELYDINSLMVNGKVEVFGLSSEGLYKYVLDLKQQQVSSKELVDRGVKNLIIKNDLLVYSTDKATKLVNDQGKVMVIDNVASEFLDVAKDEGKYYIHYVDVKPLISAKFNYAVFDYSNKSIKLFKGTTVIIGHSSNLVGSVMDVSKGYVTNLAVFMDWESGSSWTNNMTFKIGDEKNLKTSEMDLQGTNPNPMIIKSGNGYLEYIATVDNVRSYKTVNQNLAVFTLKNNKLVNKKYLTKTSGISKEPKMFMLGKDTYLEWEDVSGSSKIVNFASTNEKVIAKAKNLKSYEIFDLLLNTGVGAAWGLSFMFFFVVVIAIPALLLIVIIAMLGINWLENNTSKILNICIGLQFIAKIIITLSLGSMLTKIRAYMPVFLRHSPGLFSAVILTSLVAAYCVKRKYRDNVNQKSIFEIYIFFTLIDLALYSLIFYPYYSL
jgi:hypothetical protein